MRIYLKGYYGYKNLGDEILLLGVIRYLYTTYGFTKLFIEAKDSVRLQLWLQKNKKLLPEDILRKISMVSKRANFWIRKDLTVFGGGEVVTDARGVPYNGWTYCFWFLLTIIFGKYILLGGIGTIKFRSTHYLYKFFLGRAQTIVVRDKTSHRVSLKYNKKSILLYDFAYPILDDFKKDLNFLDKTTNIIVNCNPYIRSKEISNKIIAYIKENSVNGTIYYLPAEIGCDDLYYELLQKDIPEMQMFDWTNHSLKEIFEIIATAGSCIAARLHVLLIADYFMVKYEPLIYQEKITKILLNK